MFFFQIPKSVFTTHSRPFLNLAYSILIYVTVPHVISTTPILSLSVKSVHGEPICYSNATHPSNPPFPRVDIIRAMVTVWRVMGKFSGLFCAILCARIVHSAMHTHMNRPNSSLDWVLSHWAHFTVLRLICVLCITVYCMHA